MLKNNAFHFNLLDKYVVAFGSLFNEIEIETREPPQSGKHFPVSEDDRGDLITRRTVPIRYAKKGKALSRVLGDPEINKPSSVVLPLIAYELTDVVYENQRQLNPSQYYAVQKDYEAGIMKRQMMPVPYTLKFSVYIFTKTYGIGNQIVEQILPYFTPRFPVTLDALPEMVEPFDSDVTLISTTLVDKYDGKFEETRPIVWTLEFEMPVYIFPRIKKQPIIKFVKADFHNATPYETISDAIDNSEAIDRVTTQPGLTANGEPTTDVTKTIPYGDIFYDDDWDYATKIYGTLDPIDGTGGE